MAEIRECDRAAVSRFGIASALLMENAGRGVADAIESSYGPAGNKSYLIACGKGNNGGDGLVAARHLLLRGGKVTVLLVYNERSFRPDPAQQLKILRRLERANAANLRIIPVPSAARLRTLPEHDLIIDAIFGTGFHGSMDRRARSVVHWMNGRPETAVAIDMPSGLETDHGTVGDVAVRADMTVTMLMKKAGLVVGKAGQYAGVVKVVDIGITPQFFKQKFTAFRVGESDVRHILPRRPFDAHKHSVGKILVIAGSRGLTGAAAMAASSAMRSGAGAVVLATPESVYPVLARKLTEVMVRPVRETSAGSIAVAALEELKEHLLWADLLIVGPGLSRDRETQNMVRTLIRTVDLPVLIDADGLNAIAGETSFLRKRRSREMILTPHTGEFARLSGLAAREIEADRVGVARTFARNFSLTLVLKGAPTVTADRGGIVYVNSTGNAGMATAGAGDILTGIIGGLWAQKMRATDAALAGVYIHGLCGDRARDALGEKSLMAMDLYDAIPTVLKTLSGKQG